MENIATHYGKKGFGMLTASLLAALEQLEWLTWKNPEGRMDVNVLRRQHVGYPAKLFLIEKDGISVKEMSNLFTENPNIDFQLRIRGTDTDTPVCEHTLMEWTIIRVTRQFEASEKVRIGQSNVSVPGRHLNLAWEYGGITVHKLIPYC